jgi:hypothetical protein
MSAIRAYGIPSNSQTVLRDSAGNEVFVDRTTKINNIQTAYPNDIIVRWTGMSVASDATQQGALLVVDKSATAEDILADAGQIFSKARAAQREASGAVYTAIENASRAGISEVQIAKLAGVDRMTVRRALGNL